MTTNFNLFDFSKVQRTRSITKEPSVNVSKAGRITLNRALEAQYKGDNTHVLIGVAPNKKTIGLRFVKDDQGGKALKINVVKQTNSHYISAMPLFRELGTDLEIAAKTYKIRVEKDKNDTFIVFDLDTSKPPLIEELEKDKKDEPTSTKQK